MARIRSVHPGLLTDEAFAQLTVESPIAIALMIGLWMQADDSGAFEWKPLTIKMSCLPAAPVRVEELLDVLLGVNMIRRFEIGGRSFGVIRNFVKWQRTKRPKDVHPWTAESRAYAGFVAGKRPRAETGRPGGEEDGSLFDDEAAPRDAPLAPREPDAGETCSDNVGTCSELGPQREEGGGRRLEGPDSVVVVPITTLAKLVPRAPPTTNDDGILEKIVETLGDRAAPGVAARMARSVRPLLADGASLEADVLPELREVRAKLAGEMRAGLVDRIVEQIRDRRDGRLAAQRARGGAGPPPTRCFVARDTPQWFAWVAAGHKPGLNYSRGEMAGRKCEGWHFDSEWPPPARARAAAGAA